MTDEDSRLASLTDHLVNEVDYFVVEVNCMKDRMNEIEYEIQELKHTNQLILETLHKFV